MQDFLFNIRYSLMSLEDVSQVAATNILTLDEIKIIRTTITMDPTSIPVQSPAQSSVFPLPMLMKYSVTLNCLLFLLVIPLSVMLLTRILSDSLGNKTTTPSALDECQDELEKAMAKIDQKEKQLEEAMANIDQIQKKLEEAMAKIDQKERELKEAMAKIDQKERELEKAMAKIDQIQKKLKEAMAKIDQKERELEKAMEKIDQQEEVINSLQQEVARLKDEAERDRNQLTKKINDLAVENQALKAKVMKAQDQKNSIQPRVQRQPRDSWYMFGSLYAFMYTVVVYILAFRDKTFLSLIKISLITFIITAIIHTMTFWLL